MRVLMYTAGSGNTHALEEAPGEDYRIVDAEPTSPDEVHEVSHVEADDEGNVTIYCSKRYDPESCLYVILTVEEAVKIMEVIDELNKRA